MEHPIFVRKLDREVVMGELKRAGSTDPDIIASVRGTLLAPSKGAVTYSWGMIVAGGLLVFTIVGILASIILIPLGIFALLRAQKNIAVVNSTVAEFSAG